MVVKFLLDVPVIMGVSEAAMSFIMGLAMTLILVVFVPVIIDEWVQGIVEGIIGDSEFMTMTSDAIVQVVIWAIMLGLFVVLGAGGILKRFGVFGLLGLVFAYWLMGDVTDALIPLLMTAAMLIVLWNRRISKERRAKREQESVDGKE